MWYIVWQEEIMELIDLVGLHYLSGVDFSAESINRYGYDEVANAINFILDDVTYTAVEDAMDGYRSCMREIRQPDFKVSNIFSSVQVLAVKRTFDCYRDGGNILDFYDVKNGKCVLSVGTGNFESSYPTWIAVFTPENMSINEKI